MPQTDPRRLAAWVAAGLVLALLAAWYLSRSRPTAVAAGEPAIATIAAAGRSPPSGRGAGRAGTPVVVDVSGAVKRPGVYRLTTEDRVEDALKRAGGATRRADLSRDQPRLQTRGRPPDPRPDARQACADAQRHRRDPGHADRPVNLNTATLEQLETLDGVGPATAQKIVDYREQHGGFKTVDELDQVSGIGEKRLAALRDHVGV